MGTLFKRTDRKNGIWCAEYTGPDGKRVQRSTGARCKKTAKQILSKWESESALRRHGVIDHAAERISKQSQRGIAEHVAEFRASLEASGNTAKHVHETIRPLNLLIDSEGWLRLSDITAEGVERWAAALRKEGKKNRTLQRNIGAAKQFTKWATQTRRLTSDPLIGTRRPSPDSDRKIERRALLPEEWERLKAATETGHTMKCGLTGPVRAMLYELAIQTGLRSNEVRELTKGKLHLSAKPPFVTLPSRSTKNKNTARQYIGRALASKLRKYTKTRPAGLPLFDLPDPSNMADMARADLQRAREHWLDEVKEDPKQLKERTRSDFLADRNHENHQFDFHALRHTCGAWLAMQNENPKAIQTIMRHSTITLTMDTYGHLFPSTESEAIARLEKNYF